MRLLPDKSHILCLNTNKFNNGNKFIKNLRLPTTKNFYNFDSTISYFRMKYFLTFLFICIVFINSNGQGCLPEGIRFTTQSQIDSFALNYPGCTFIEGDVMIDSENSITNLNGLSVLTRIGGSLALYCYSLPNLSGLNNLSFIGDYFSISHCSLLTDISALNNIDTIKGSVRIHNNPLLVSVNGFNSLQYLGGNLEIYWNSELSSINAFPITAHDSIDELKIYENYYLINCSSPLICAFLADPRGPVSIYSNGTGCNSPGEITETCGVPHVCLPYGNQFILSQSDVDNFSVNNPGCSTLHGLTYIGSNTVTNLNGLSQVTHIAGDLMITNGPDNTAPEIIDLYGLQNIDSIDGNLYLGSLGLTNLSGLDNLEYIGFNFQVNRLFELTSLDGLQKLKSVRNVELIVNPSLTSLTGLDSITKIRGSLGLYNNNNLTDLTALSRLDTIVYNLELHGLNQLTDFQQLSNIKYVGWGLNVYNNTSLTSLQGLENIAGTIMNSVSVYWNPMLTECEVASICSYLADTGAYTYIYNNGPGCYTVEQVRSACETVDAGNLIPEAQITLYPNPSKGIFILSGDVYAGNILSIFEYSGRKLMEFTLNKEESVIDISTLPPGLYLAVIRDSMRVTACMVIKE